MNVEAIVLEIRDLKRRVELAETRLSQVEGRFEYISGQLRDMQLYQHAKFSEIDGRLDKIDGRLDKIDGRFDKIDGRLDKQDVRLTRIESRLDDLTSEVRALPRAIAELIAKR